MKPEAKVIRPGVGLAGLILNGDKILMGLRKGSHGSGAWAPPGGHLEMFEDFDDDYLCIHHFQIVATLAYLDNKERVFPDEDPEEELERCSIHYLLEILARSPIYEEEEDE